MLVERSEATSEPTTDTKRRSPLKPVSDDDLKRVATMRAYGLNQFQIASLLGMSRATLQRYCKRYKDFNDAMEKGDAYGLHTSGAALFQKVKEGDVQAIKWFETTRHKMTEKTETDVTVKVESIESYLRRMKHEAEDDGVEVRAINHVDPSADNYSDDNGGATPPNEYDDHT